MDMQAVAGSERTPMPGARLVGAADPSAPVTVTLMLRRPDAETFGSHLAAATTMTPHHLPRDAYKQRFAVRSADLARIRGFAQRTGLTIASEDPVRRSVMVSGTVAAVSAAFGVQLEAYEHTGGRYRGRTGPVYVPADIADLVSGVFGLDNRPQAAPHFRVAAAAPVSYTPPQLAQLYGFPAATGQGQCIGIVELGGGYAASDLQTYFSQLGIAAPTVTAVPVDGGANIPTGDSNGPDGEVFLDVEVAGAIAPAARIAVYFAPNTDAGFLDAITTAIHDATNAPSVISISWGGPESTFTQQARMAFDDAFATAATLGITVCVACGDNGSTDGVTDGVDHVDFPASSPHVLACGGTRLAANGTTIALETVWNDGASGGATGGGVSAVFARPTWQDGLSAANAAGSVPLTMRGLPDICANADPQSGYAVGVDGRPIVIGGTSAVAPLWAGLIARINSMRGNPAGFINPVLYANPATCNDIVSGNNGTYVAAPGWDACTGLGSPNGMKIAAVLP